MDKPVLFDANMSPAGRRVRMALTLEELDFSRVEADLALMDQKSRYYLEMNPTGVVPTLLVGSKAIFDSHEIVDYVLAFGEHKGLLDQEFCGFDRGCLQSIERMLAQIMRPAVYETVGVTRLKTRFDSWASLESTLIERGVRLADRQFVKDVYSKSPDNEVVDDVASKIESVFLYVEKIIKGAVHDNSSLINYFDMCMGPRLHAISALGLDRQGLINEYITNLKNKELWLSTDDGRFNQEFIHYKESN